MTLAPGTRLGPYEILAPLGAGGMGEVYRARDPRLGRDVAIKALPEAFARDPERLARFEREARLLASLSHPNIAGILGLEEAGGTRHLVLEFVEGETLAQRLARGPLPVDEALDVCRQVAAGVEAAHESGVVHRDLKPGNIMLTPAGGVKVLDFGLARSGAAGRPGSDPNLSESPTMTYAATGAGVILGTAAYMSPEQARGRSVDRRTDVWSFGCVLFECLTGRALFQGDTVSDLIARILEREPEWSALPAGTPPRVRDLLRRCLRKDAKERLRDIGDARLELDEAYADALAGPAGGAPGSAAGVPRPGALRAAWLPWAVLAAGLLAAAFGLWRGWEQPARDPHLHAVLPHDGAGLIVTETNSVAISPDGRRIAYVAADSSSAQLWVRDLDAPGPRRVGDMSPVLDVFWSPDSREIGFTTSGDGPRMWKVPARGGSPVSICDVNWSRGASWGAKGVIVFAPATDGPLYQVRASGGEPKPVTRLDSTRHQTAHRMPWFLPDGEHFLYAALPRGERGWDIYVGSLRGGKPKWLLTAGSGVTYADPGYLLYVRDGRLVAQRFDAGSLEVTGDPIPFADPPAPGNVDATWVATASHNGRLAMLLNRAPDTRVGWVDRGGANGSALPLPPGRYSSVRLSPDGASALAERSVSAVVNEIWYADPARGTTSRLTPAGRYAYAAVWLPDGSGFAYTTTASTGERVYTARLGDPSAPRAVPDPDVLFQHPTGVTPDGRALIVGIVDPATQFDIWAVPLAGGRPQLLVRTAAWEESGTVSPDGRWLAYDSDETGQREVFVQPYPGPGPKTRVSVGGGQSPQWSQGGRELLYARPEPGGATLMSVQVAAGAEFSAGTPRALFHRAGLLSFSPSPDGSRFLVSAEAGTVAPPAIALTLDWASQLKGR